MNRRNFLTAMLGTSALAALPRLSFGEPTPGTPFWINIQAAGAWDPALLFDPKPNLRGRLASETFLLYGVPTLTGPSGTGTISAPSSNALRSTPGGGIPYLGFADLHGDPTNPLHPYKCFLPTYYDRVTIINGVDTGTVNHDVGARFCASGSLNEGYPCFASQVAAANGSERALSFLNMGGYDETAGIITASRLDGKGLPSLLRLMGPNDLSGDNQGSDVLLAQRSLDRVLAAHAQRVMRLRSSQRLPEHRRGLDSLAQAESGVANLQGMRFNANDQGQKNLLAIGIDAFRRGIATSMNVVCPSFDSHDNNEQTQAAAVYNLFETLRTLLIETETPSSGSAPVPAVLVVTSDFGRSPYYRNAGTDHWSVGSVMIIQNTLAKSLGLGLPTNRVIGGTTGGNENVALRPLRVNPSTLALDDRGIVITPGHVLRALRRLAKIDSSPRIAAFPLSVDRDLSIG